MLKFVTVVLCYLFYVFNASCTPIIKASGVQWSEPKGTGKGNITLIIVPQNSSCSNDTDMIVAVKSDYQILSQDMQLLSLVVNETQNDKINETQCGESLSSYIQNDADEPGGSKWKLNKINLTNNANYFELPGKSGNNHSNSDQSFADKNNASKTNMFPEGSNSIDVFNLLNSVANHSSDIKIADANTPMNINLPSTRTNNNLVNLNPSEQKNSVLLSSNASSVPKENNLNNSNDPSLDSNDSFLREAFDIFDKLKPNQSYNKPNVNDVQSLHSSGTESKIDDKPKHVKGGDLKLADEDILIKELPYELVKNDKSFIEGNNAALTSPTTCVPFFFVPNNSQQVTLASSDVSSIFNLLTSSEYVNVEDKHLTTIINEEEKTAPASMAAISASDGVAPIAYGISTNPQAAKENVAPNLIEMLGVQPTADNCTTVGNQHEITTSSIGVFDEISEMISSPSNKISRETQLYVTKSNLEAGIGNFANTLTTECRTVAISSLEPGKEATPKKITLEPKIKCDELSIATKLHNHSQYDDNKSIGNNVNLPVVESPVVLVNKDEMTKRNDISSALKASYLDDFKLADFIEKADHESNFVKPAELYEPPLVLHISNKARNLDHPQPLVLGNVKEKRKGVHKNNPTQKVLHAGSEIGKILKMRFFGKNIVLDQKPSYRSEISNNKQDCDVKLNVLTDSADYDSIESKTVSQTVLQSKSVAMVNNIGITTILQDKNQTNNFSPKSSLGTPPISLEGVTTGKPTKETVRSKGVYSTLESVTSIPVKEKDRSSTTTREEDKVEPSQIARITSTAFSSTISTSSDLNIITEFPLFNISTCMSNPKSNDGLTNAEDLTKEPGEQMSPQYTTSMSSNEKKTNTPSTSTIQMNGDDKIIRTEAMAHLTITSNASKCEYPTTKNLKFLENLGAFSKEKSSTVSSESGESDQNEFESIPKSIRIPSNSVKEIVIQIKTNKKPIKGKNYVTKKCVENKGKSIELKGQESPSYLERDILSHTPDRQMIFNNDREKIFKLDTFSGNNNPDKTSKLITVNENFSGENIDPINRDKDVSSNHDHDPDDDYDDNELDGVQNVLTEDDYHDNGLDGMQNVLTEDSSLPKFMDISKTKSNVAKDNIANNLLNFFKPDNVKRNNKFR